LEVLDDNGVEEEEVRVLLIEDDCKVGWEVFEAVEIGLDEDKEEGLVWLEEAEES
jgi:hypothetical protein